MKRTALLLTCLLISSLAIADQNNKKKADTKSWKPSAFILETDRLPAGYTGLDAKKFFKLFKSKAAEFQKKEFETSEEFNQRVANADAIFSPIKESELYAFSTSCNGSFSHESNKYDPDTQTYKIIGHAPFWSSGWQAPNWVTCVLAQISRGSTYSGSNAYGAYRDVQRLEGVSISLAISKNSPLFSTVLSSSPNDLYYDYQDTITVPLEKARKLKNMEVSVLFVGSVSHAQIISGKGVYNRPTIDDPIDISITEEAIPFNIKKVIYYVVKTGEILGQRDFSSDEIKTSNPPKRTAGPLGRFEAADMNHDGALTRKEAKDMPMLSLHFDEVDTNKDGKVTIEELKSMMDAH